MHTYWTGFLLVSLLTVPALFAQWHDIRREAREELRPRTLTPLPLLANNYPVKTPKRKG